MVLLTELPISSGFERNLPTTTSPTHRRSKSKVAAWAKENPERARAKLKRWKAANPDKVKADKTRQYERNPSEYAAHCGASRAKRVGGGSAIPGTEEWRRIVQLYADCAELTKRTGIRHEVDHVTPLSHGGGHFIDNLQILTATEHRQKSDEDLRFLKAVRERLPCL